MIDEFFDKKVDEWSERANVYWKPRLVRLGDFVFFWRIKLYIVAIVDALKNAVVQSEELDRAEEERQARKEHPPEEYDPSAAKRRAERLKAYAEEKRLARMENIRQREKADRIRAGIGERLWRMNAYYDRVVFMAALMLSMLAMLGVVATGGRGPAVCAASLMVLWISEGVRSRYAPLSSAVRQKYLVSTLLRAASMTIMLLYYFAEYAAYGVVNNVVLQGAMIVTLFVHAVLFFSLVAFNAQQQRMTRVLAGLLGIGPALMAASALALGVAGLGRPMGQALGGVLGAMGAVLAFLWDQLMTVTQLGSIRLKYIYTWSALLMLSGFTLMLAGAWLFSPTL